MISLAIFLFVAFLMLFLGGVVYVHDPKDSANKYFLIWIACAFVWMSCNYLESVGAISQDTRILLLQADFASAMFGSGFILLFVLKFLGIKTTDRQMALYLLPEAIMAAMSYSPWLFNKIYFTDAGDIRFIEGPLFNLYAPVLVVVQVLSCVLLLRAVIKSQGERRSQVLPVAIGLTASTVTALVINLYFQNILSADLFRVGIYVWLLFIIGVSWSIGRHKFLKVRLVAAEILLLGVLATMLTRTILSVDWQEAMINGVSLAILLILGFAMIRSFLNEERRREEVQHLAAELSASNKRLRQLDDLKTTMVSIASHQIRGPLGGIRGYLTMFRDGDLGPINEKQKEIVTLNLNVSTRLLNAVETFLDITKLESGALTLRKEVLPLDDAVIDVVEEFKLPAQKKGLALTVGFACPRPVWVDFDPDKIKHVIFNLIDNAMKYTDTGAIDVRVRCDGREAVLEVVDTGMGIVPADASRLFGKFERGELVIDRGGSGLGLYVIKMLTEMQGGRVWATSPGVGKGSTFSVALPLSRDIPKV